MFRHLCAVAALAALCAALPPARADDAADARAIVEKGIKAIGPEDVLAKVKAHTWKVKGKFSLMGQTMPYACEYFLQMPDRFRFVMDMEFMGQKTQITAVGTNGKAWQSMMGKVEEMPEAKTKEFNHEIYIFRVSMLVALREPGYKLTSLGEAKSLTGQAQLGVKVSRDGQRDVTLFFDKSTGLLARSLTRVHDEFSNKEVTQETIIEDYKKGKDGVTVIGKLKILRDGKVFIEEELFDQKGLEKLDDALFQKP